jgi:leucyl aminopeptidase
MKLTLTARPLEAQAKEAWIIFVQNKKPLLSGHTELVKLLSSQIKKTGFSGDYAQTLVFPTFLSAVASAKADGKLKAENIVLAGLGDRKHFRMEYLERAASAAVRAGKKAGIKNFATVTATEISKASEAAFVRAVARGAAWGSYSFDTFKTGGKKSKGELSLTFAGPCGNGSACRKALAEAELESKALLATADLANLPGNEATPLKISNWAQKMAKENKLAFSVCSKTELKKKGCNAILAVAAGSAQDAKIITLKYKGTNPKAKPVVLVGKTITFDSGGLSLKTGKHMEWMQYDKSGGMAVLAAMQMVAQLKPATPVIGMLAVAENMPSGSAARPGDIVKAHNGKTIEILNTDAEGRLVLADALSLAKLHKPAAIVDLATLTGAVVTALGYTAAAIVGNDHKLNQTLIKAGDAAGERLWELPLWPENMDDMKGTFADLRNISKSSTAGTTNGAAFLANFVPEEIPWAHLDIAGTAYEEHSKAWTDAGATLFGARTLIEWINGIK